MEEPTTGKRASERASERASASANVLMMLKRGGREEGGREGGGRKNRTRPQGIRVSGREMIENSEIVGNPNPLFICTRYV